MGADGLHEGAIVELLDAAPDGILVVDGEGRIAFVNEAVERLFGHRPAELVGQPIEVLVPERSRVRHVADRTAYAAAPRPRPMGLGLALQGLRRDGSEFPVEISLAPMTKGAGGLVVAIVRDAT